VTGAHPQLRPRSARAKSRPRSILLYSHDTYGLGHFRRNLAIAHAIRRHEPSADLVMLTGSALARDWHLPEAVDLVRMPGVVKVGPEDYRALAPISMSALRAERVGLICSTLLSFRPDVFLVDHAPLGMKGELRLALELTRDALLETRIVLGLRDILDDPETVRRTWTEQGVYAALESFYDQVLVYGCREMFDVGELYSLPRSVRRRTVFTGYVAKDYSVEPTPARASVWNQARSTDERRVLVMGGGGGDAEGLFRAFLRAWPRIAKTGAVRALLVTGPLMPDSAREEVERLAARARVDLVRSSTSMLSLIAAADVVVSMGGYNSVVESLSARRALVIFPRTAPRREQLIRARMLERLGLARMVVPSKRASRELGVAVIEALEEPLPPPEAWRQIDLGGGDRIAQALLEPVRSQAAAG
jgi:predicted glycosyltransferase